MTAEMFAIRDQDGYYFISGSRFLVADESKATAFVDRRDAKAIAERWRKNCPSEKFEVVSIWRERVTPESLAI